MPGSWLLAIMSPEKVPSRREEEIKENLYGERKVEEEEVRRKRRLAMNVLPPALCENSRRQW